MNQLGLSFISVFQIVDPVHTQWRGVLTSPLPKFSPGPEESFFGWACQVEAILHLPGPTERAKSAYLLNAIPAEILNKVFCQKSGGYGYNMWKANWRSVL